MQEQPPFPPIPTHGVAANDAEKNKQEKQVDVLNQATILNLDAPMSEVRHKIALLQAEHRELDQQIANLISHPQTEVLRDDLLLVRLKKRKLKIKDTILLLQLQLEPDELA